MRGFIGLGQVRWDWMGRVWRCLVGCMRGVYLASIGQGVDGEDEGEDEMLLL